MSHIPAMAVPMGDDPTTSRLTTERSAVELRNHVESRAGIAPTLGEFAALCLTAWRPTHKMTDLDSNQDRPGQNRLCCRVLHHPSMERPAGFAPALPRWQRGVLLDELRSHKVVEPRGIEPAIRCVQNSSPTVERRPHETYSVLKELGASNGLPTRSCGLTNRRACDYTVLAMEPHLRFELSRSALRKRCSS
jgi:hypothetical protein